MSYQPTAGSPQQTMQRLTQEHAAAVQVHRQATAALQRVQTELATLQQQIGNMQRALNELGLR